MNFLEIQFDLRGKTLPSDHGYSIYSAVKKTVLEEKSLPPEVLLCSVPGVPAAILILKKIEYYPRCWN